MKRFYSTLLFVISLAFILNAQNSNPDKKNQQEPVDETTLNLQNSSQTQEKLSKGVRACYFENFENISDLPKGWKVINAGDTAAFHLSNRHSFSGTNCMRIGWSNDVHRDFLITPQLEITESNFMLSTMVISSDATWLSTYDVMVSTTGTDTADFELLKTEVDPGLFWAQKFYELDSYAGQKIYVAFRANSKGYGLVFDDITLPTIVYPNQNNVLIENILPTTTIEDSAFTPVVTIANHGNADEASYSVKLTDGNSYSETINITEVLLSGDAHVLDFPEYISDTTQTITFTATVTVTTDEDETNNTLSQEVYIYRPIFEQHGFVNGVGVHSTGADISMLESTQTGLGKAFTNPHYKLADDFTVLPGDEWTVDGFRFFAYQTGSKKELSTMYTTFVEIYKGKPGEGGTVVKDFGNVLLSSKWSGAYRMETGDITTTMRPIMEMICKIPKTVLEQGEYWVMVSANGANRTAADLPLGPHQVHLQFTDGITETGNAIRFRDGSYVEWMDNYEPQGMPFDVFGVRKNPTIGIKNKTATTLNINAYPNPTNGLINLDIDSNYKATVQDVTGKVILSKSINPLNATIDLTEQPEGIYFIKLMGNETTTLKVLKK